MMQVTPGSFELTPDNRPTICSPYGMSADISDLLFKILGQNGYSFAVNDRPATDSRELLASFVNHQNVDTITVLKGATVAGTIRLDWKHAAQICNAAQVISSIEPESLEIEARPATAYAFSLEQSEMVDA